MKIILFRRSYVTERRSPDDPYATKYWAATNEQFLCVGYGVDETEALQRCDHMVDLTLDRLILRSEFEVEDRLNRRGIQFEWIEIGDIPSRQY